MTIHVPLSTAPAHAEPVRLPFFSKGFLHNLVLKHGLCQHLLEPCVLYLKRPQPLHVGHLKTSVLASPHVVTALREPVASAQVLDPHATLGFLQEPHNLLFRKPLLHVQPPCHRSDSRAFRDSFQGGRRLFDQVAGPDPTAIAPRSLAGVRFAILKEALWSDLHPAVEQATREGLQRLQAAGAILVDAQFPALVALVDAITAPVQSHDVRIALAGYLQHYRAGLGFAEVISAASPDIQATFRHSVFVGSPGFITEARYAQIVRALLPQLRQAFAAFFASTQTDAIVFPTTRITAPQIGAEGPADLGGRCIDFTRALAGNISFGSTAGLPGLVLPVGFDPKGLPISMEFDGPAGSDRRLLALAPALEKALGRLAPPKQLT